MEAKRAITENLRAAARGIGDTADGLVAWAKSLLSTRRYAFRNTFNPDLNPHALTVLAVLAKASNPDRSTFHADPRVHAFNEGMREMFLIIQRYSNLTEEQLWEIYARKDLE